MPSFLRKLWAVNDEVNSTELNRVESGVENAHKAVHNTSAVRNIAPPFVSKKVFTQFQPGHGTVAAGTGAVGADDTSTYVVGTQSYKLTTNGAGAAATADFVFATPENLSASVLRITFRVTGQANLSALQIYATPDNWTNFVAAALPTRLLNYQREGEWVTITVNRADFTASVQGTMNWAAVTRLRIRLVDIGGSVPISVNVQELSAHPEPSTANGEVILFFDDAWISTYTKAFPILHKAGLPFVVPVIRDLSNTGSNGTYCNPTQLRYMQDFGGAEICAHADTVANHNAGFDTLADSVVEAEFMGIKSWLLDQGLRGADHFIWPKGQFTASQVEIAKRYFATQGTTVEAPKETWPVGDWHRLRRYVVASSYTTATIQAQIDSAIARRGLLFLTFHNIVDSAPGSSDYTTANLQTVVNYLVSSGVKVRTLTDLYLRGL